MQGRGVDFDDAVAIYTGGAAIAEKFERCGFVDDVTPRAAKLNNPFWIHASTLIVNETAASRALLTAADESHNPGSAVRFRTLGQGASPGYVRQAC